MRRRAFSATPHLAAQGGSGSPSSAEDSMQSRVGMQIEFIWRCRAKLAVKGIPKMALRGAHLVRSSSIYQHRSTTAAREALKTARRAGPVHTSHP